MQNSAVEIGQTDQGLAKRESGLIVPNHLANAPDAAKPAGYTPVARDMDGRRRIVFSDEDRRKLNHVLTILGQQGLGTVVGCVQQMAHKDGGQACGGILIAEGRGTDDPGYGCKCTRIHWAKPSQDQQGRFIRKMARGRR